MTGWFSSWRAAIRIARRDAWRFKGRSLLVLAMIALPIMGVSAADITIRSSQLTKEQALRLDIGAADARLSGLGNAGQPIYQGLEYREYAPVDESDQARGKQGPSDIKAAIPAGAAWTADTTGGAKVRTAYGLLDVEVRELKASDPIAAGITKPLRGRVPAAPDEVMATDAFLKASGLHVGSKVFARDLPTEYRIVGAYELPVALKKKQLNALPGALLKPLGDALTAAGRNVPGTDTSYLVSVDGDFTWNMVKQANTKGVYVQSRAVGLHPPAKSEVPLYVKHPDWARDYGSSASGKAALLAAAATVAGLAMLEICLLAGPAFAVGARRSRRQLGLVGANGGDRRHIRAIVLAGGLVIGAVAAVIGTVLGLALTLALRGVLEDYTGKRFGGIVLRPPELLGIAVLAVVTGLLAAIVPAIVASRQSVLASLTGRRGIRRANRVLPFVGLAAVCLGTGITVVGAMRSDTTLVVAGGSAMAELGVVALTPTLVGLFGRLSGKLPLSPRLALRDAVRNRGRTAPAVAAVLAAVAGTVAVATYAVSDDRQQRDAYEARLPYGSVVVRLDAEGGRDLGAVRTAVEKHLPVAARADVERPVTGRKVCDMWRSRPGCGRVEMVVPKANECPLDKDGSDKLSTAERRKFAKDWRCDRPYHPSAMQTDSDVLVGGRNVLRALGIHDPAAEQAMERGETVLFDGRYAEHGRISLRLIQDDSLPVASGKDPAGPVKAFPAHLSADSPSYGVRAVMPPSAAKAAGLATVPLGSFFTNERMPTSQERQELDGDISKLGVDPDLYLEEGYVSQNGVVTIALTVFAGLVTIGAAAIATGLAQADAEPDLRTLAAIGAAPRVRRALSGFQCGVVAAMGVILGSAAGILPAIGLRKAEERQELKFYHRMIDEGFGSDKLPHVPIVVPWGTLMTLLVAVPLGAALLAALVTRSHAAVARRAAE